MARRVAPGALVEHMSSILVGDIQRILKEGHGYFVSPRSATGTRATGLAVHSRSANAVYKIINARRLAAAHLRTRKGVQASNLDVCIMSLHAPSAIGHEPEELDVFMRAVAHATPGNPR